MKGLSRGLAKAKEGGRPVSHSNFIYFVTTQVGRLKTVRKNGNTAHFEAMFGAKTCSLSTNVRQSCFSDSFSLQSKQLQPDYVSSHFISS